MNSTIIELRENKSNPINPVEFGGEPEINGSYSVDISEKNILLQEGDSISVRSCFLDTRSESAGKINITDELADITISNYLYMNDFRPTKDQTTVNYIVGASAQEQGRPDGKFYILSQNVTPAGNYRKVLDARAKGNDRSFGETFGGFNQTYEYTDHNDQKQTVTFAYPPVNSMANPRPFFSIVDHVGTVVFKSTGNLANDFKLINSTTNYKKYFCDTPVITTEPAAIGEGFFPVVLSTNFQIPKGEYTPDLLARVITDKIVQVNQTPGADLTEQLPVTNLVGNPGGQTKVFPVRNKFVTSTQQVRSDTFFGLNQPNSVQLVAHDGRSVMEIIADPGDASYLIGASEMALEFDEDEDKFSLKALHTSMFNSNGQPVVRYFDRTNGGSFLNSSLGGVIIKDLRPAALWSDILGFDLSTLCVSPEPAIQFNSIGGAITNSLVHAFNLTIGVNLTQNLRGMDASVIKEDFVEGAGAAQKGSDIVRDTSQIVTEQTEGTATLGISDIKAQKTFGNFTFKDGYFLLRINGLPAQDLHSMPNQTIQAIVSKYYSSGSFTIMEGGAGSFNYTHKGNPFYLHDLVVQVLEPDGRPAENLGNNNTVFLEIIKNPERLISY